MKRTGLILLFFLSVFSCMRTQATHIVGGEMYYEYIGGDKYKITLYIYRDCIRGWIGFDSPARVSVFDSNNTRLWNINLYNPPVEQIPLEINDSCTYINEVCYEVATYEFIDSFPPIPGGYTVVYDRCCWNESVNNIKLPLENGLAVVAYLPDTNVALNNSNPVFKNRTPPFICVNQEFKFDHSAIDADGDSLAYELFTPLNSTRQWDSELAPLPPPYNPLIYQFPPYNLNNLLGGVPMKIDVNTGILTATPNTIGQFVFGVKVKEYRDGNLIGESSRSYQINVQQCYRFTVAKFEEPINQCGDSIVTFNNKSDSAMGYLWHFGDAGSNDSISNSPFPTHIYSGEGSYTVTLVAQSFQGNTCNDTFTGRVNIFPELVGNYDWEDEECDNYVQFNDLTNSVSGPITNWNWRFGDGSGSKEQNPYHYFELSGEPRSYNVSLSIENIHGCVDSISQLYTGLNRKYEIRQVGLSREIIYPREDSTLLFAEADSAVSYEWSPKESLSSPFSSETFASPNEDTKYTVVAIDGRGCEAIDEITVEVEIYACGESVVFIPNAFSPNGDGENDYLRVRGEEITKLELAIFNRWGEMVFESFNPQMTRDISLGWDGRNRGVMQDPGVYVYQLKATCSDGHKFTKKGNITLIR